MLNRRDLFGLMPLVLIPHVLRSVPRRTSVDAAFPSQPPALVKEMVIASHGNVARVKELVGRSPAFARAAFDWGYGDWEDALGAASHVGNREIAEFLIANGARPTIFSAAMLGQLDAVKALIAASPGIEAIHGPHSITLLKHAIAGGPGAQPVADFLKMLPAADRRPSTQPLTGDEIAALCGTYTFGPDAADRFVVVASNAAMTANGWPMTMARGDYSPRGLAHLGDHAFYPAGATGVRIRFTNAGGALTVSVFDPDLIVTAGKTA
jgi:hypothetical protein